MQNEWTELIELNVQIGEAECQGDAEFLGHVLTPHLAFRRADGTVVNRETFLETVKPSARRTTNITSIRMLGRHRAVLTCVVSMELPDETKSFDNIRIFVRSETGQWLLLGWANEPIDAQNR